MEDGLDAPDWPNKPSMLEYLTMIELYSATAGTTMPTNSASFLPMSIRASVL
jgi:hypothetical protein